MISHSNEETEKLAKKIFRNLKPQKERATVFGLYGDLGVGKTTFTQFIAKELGVKRKVNSPTFVIMKKYPISKTLGLKYKYFFHLDAYRLKNEKELLHLGWDKIIENKEHLVFIEWPENIKKAMPKKHHQIHISHTKEGNRKFEIKNI